MNAEKADNEFSQWFSTYGVITAERILGKYQIKLAQTDLVAAFKNQQGFFHYLLRTPLKNILNGIILQQTNDYHVYAQKLFIDYLLSGESSKTEEAQGSATREAIEHERQQLVTLGDEFHKIQAKHDQNIASSQATLIKITKELNTQLEITITSLKKILRPAGFSGKNSQIRRAINYSLIHCNMRDMRSDANKSLFVEKMNEILTVSLSKELMEKMINHLSNVFQILFDFDDRISSFFNDVQEISNVANLYRNQFFDTIIRVIDLIKLLPDYKIDPEQDAINREPLYFDKNIGAL